MSLADYKIKASHAIGIGLWLVSVAGTYFITKGALEKDILQNKSEISAIKADVISIKSTLDKLEAPVVSFRLNQIDEQILKLHEKADNVIELINTLDSE